MITTPATESPKSIQAILNTLTGEECNMSIVERLRETLEQIKVNLSELFNE